MSGDPAERLRERHDASDFDTKTQGKIGKWGGWEEFHPA
jgi:GST-like protein